MNLLWLKKVAFALVVVIAIVCIWRGVWGLLDLYLIPNDLVASFSLSVLIGFLILAFTGKKLVRLLIGG